MSSLLQLKLIKLRLPHNATLIVFNHNIEIVAYTYYSPTRKVYYVVIESLNPIRLCFRKKLTSLHWIYIDNRDILITSFESGYIGCFDIDGRLLFKQQIDNKPILNIYLHSSHRQLQNNHNNNIPNLLCLQENGVILITSYDLYSTLKYSNFDISLLSQQQRKEYFLQIEYDKKKQQNKLKQQTHLKYSRNIHNKKYTSPNNNNNNHKHRRFTFDDANPIRATAAISPRVIIAPLPDDKDIDMLPPTYHQYQQLKNNNGHNDELYAYISSPSTPNTPNTPDFVFSSSSSPSSFDDVKHSKINKYTGGVNSIPITTILPLRPICNKILYWNAKKILVSTDQKLTCFAACFFPLSEKSFFSENKIEKELEDTFGRRPHPGFNLNLSTHNLSNANLIQTPNNFKKRNQSANLYAHHHRSHSEADIYINNQKIQNNKQYTHEDNNLSQLINPQVAFKNNNDESWLILLCGSNPMIAAIHIEIIQEKNIKTNDKTSQSVTSWFTAAKSLFLNKKHKTTTNNEQLSAIKIPHPNINDNTSDIGRSPSKSPRVADKNTYRNPDIKNTQDHKKKKKKNRDQILLAQKHTQHTIRDQKYSKYLANFELRNNKVFNKKASKNNLKHDHVSIESITMSPDSEYGAFTDSFGRIWIWDCKQCHFVRLFKGYRRAQIAWCYVNNDVDKLISCINGDISDMHGYGQKYDNGRANTNITNIISSVVFAIKKKEKERRRDIFGSIPSYIYRRSILLLVLYIESRGLLEFHYIGCYKRLYAVSIFKKATMIYHLNYSVSPPWTSILFVRKGHNNNNKNKVYKLNIDSSIIYNNNTKLRRLNDVWDRKNLHCNSPIKLLSDQQIYFNGNYSQRFSIFGTQYISPVPVNVKKNKCSAIIQWFVLVNKCDGDICVGIQLIDKILIKPQTQNHGDFANDINGWGYHCDGFLKCNASFSRYGWKYGKYDTIGIILNIKNSTLKFSLNGKLCSRNNGLTLPNVNNGNNNSNSIYRLAVSVGLNSVAQLTIIGFCK